jgi:hypothetical protein
LRCYIFVENKQSTTRISIGAVAVVANKNSPFGPGKTLHFVPVFFPFPRGISGSLVGFRFSFCAVFGPETANNNAQLLPSVP